MLFPKKTRGRFGTIPGLPRVGSIANPNAKPCKILPCYV